MASRDEAKALKDRQTIDYHMFLTSKLTDTALLSYDDNLEKKFSAKATRFDSDAINEQSSKENRVGNIHRSDVLRESVTLPSNCTNAY